MRLARAICLFLVISQGSFACRSASSERPSRPAREAGASQSPYLIEGEELKSTDALNLYDAIRIRRPTWLARAVRNTRGGNAVAVYLDDRRIGSMSILREMPLYIAQALQYLSPSEAQIRFGPSHGSRAAIVVVYAKP